MSNFLKIATIDSAFTTVEKALDAAEIKRIRQALLSDMHDFGRELLTERLVMPLETFEEALRDEFHGRFTTVEHSNVKGTTRQRWENLTDWVKADMTKEKVSAYIVLGGVRHLVWCPAIGIVNGHGAIIDKDHILRLLEAIQAIAK